jgi:hypothetical protein
VRLLDADGKPHALLKKLDEPPPHGIQYQLGTGTTAYLHMLWYLGWCFTAAFLLSIPTLALNVSGGRLSSLNLVNAGVLSMSLANRRPFERDAPYMVIDFLVILTLAAGFYWVHRRTRQMEQVRHDSLLALSLALALTLALALALILALVRSPHRPWMRGKPPPRTIPSSSARRPRSSALAASNRASTRCADA